MGGKMCARWARRVYFKLWLCPGVAQGGVICFLEPSNFQHSQRLLSSLLSLLKEVDGIAGCIVSEPRQICSRRDSILARLSPRSHKVNRRSSQSLRLLFLPRHSNFIFYVFNHIPPCFIYLFFIYLLNNIINLFFVYI